MAYRATLCKDCLDAGKCKICGCKTPALFFAPEFKDESNKWGAFLPQEEWTQFKTTPEYINITETEDYKWILQNFTQLL